MEPTDLRYHEEHEWIRVDGKQATMGISNFAQDALGDIVFIDMPKVGSVVTAGQQIVTLGAFKLRNGAPIVVNNEIQLSPSQTPTPQNR